MHIFSRKAYDITVASAYESHREGFIVPDIITGYITAYGKYRDQTDHETYDACNILDPVIRPVITHMTSISFAHLYVKCYTYLHEEKQRRYQEGQKGL